MLTRKSLETYRMHFVYIYIYIYIYIPKKKEYKNNRLWTWFSGDTLLVEGLEKWYIHPFPQNIPNKYISIYAQILKQYKNTHTLICRYVSMCVFLCWVCVYIQKKNSYTYIYIYIYKTGSIWRESPFCCDLHTGLWHCCKSLYIYTIVIRIYLKNFFKSVR